MTKQQMIVGGVVAVGALLLFGGKAAATVPAPRKRVTLRDPGKVAAFLSTQGLVGSTVYHADGSVTETEQNFWAGTPKVSRTWTAEEWARREAALDAGNLVLPLAEQNWAA